jgi:ribonuclease HII
MNASLNPRLLSKSPDLRHERALWSNGLLWVAGVDEAGRGALAGPVAAAAVVLPQIADLIKEYSGVRDSKLMTPVQRKTWVRVIRDTAVTYGIGMASAAEIDRHGILPATQMAVARAVGALAVCPDFLLVDYIKLPEIPIPQISLVKGDVCSLSIAAASILAKTSRDALLQNLDERYPGYGFGANKGYGTSFHLDAIQRLGPSPLHRMSFAPLLDRQIL